MQSKDAVSDDTVSFFIYLRKDFLIYKNAPQDAHSREDEGCCKQSRSARECVKAHSILYNDEANATCFVAKYSAEYVLTRSGR